MKNIFKSVSLIVLLFVFVPIVNAQTMEEILEKKVVELKSVPIDNTNKMHVPIKYLFNPVGRDGVERVVRDDGTEDYELIKTYSLVIDEIDNTKGIVYKYTRNESGSSVKVKECDVQIRYVYSEKIKEEAEDIITKLKKDNDHNYKLYEFDKAGPYFSSNESEECYTHPAGDNMVGSVSSDGKRCYDNLGWLTESPSLLNYNSDFRKKLGDYDFIVYGDNDSCPGVNCSDHIDSSFGIVAKDDHLILLYEDTYYGYVNYNYTLIYKPILFVENKDEDVKNLIKKELEGIIDVAEVGTSSGMTVDYYKQNLNEAADEYCSGAIGNSSETEYFGKTKEYCIEKEVNKYLGEGTIGDYLDDPNILPDLYYIKPKDKNVRYWFFVIKDDKKSGKLNTKATKKDINTNIEIISDIKNLNETSLSIEKVESGDNYNKIITLLSNKDVEMYDIKLYSETNKTYITKLEDGKFKIKIPLSEKFINKKLFAFYIDENDNIEKFEVKVEDGYAIFETDHLSIYTLGEDKTVKSRNPQTGDNIMIYVTTLILSSVYLLTRKLRKN